MNKNEIPECIQKFRGYWSQLTKDEQQEMWNILTALRGPDNPSTDKEKTMTTAKIRYYLFGDSIEYYNLYFKNYEKYIGFEVNSEPLSIKDLKYVWEKYIHFSNHIVLAYGTILHFIEGKDLSEMVAKCGLEV